LSETFPESICHTPVTNQSQGKQFQTLSKFPETLFQKSIPKDVFTGACLQHAQINLPINPPWKSTMEKHYPGTHSYQETRGKKQNQLRSDLGLVTF